MHRRAVRLTLLGLLLVAGVGAAIRVWTIERGVQSIEERRRALDGVVDRLDPAIAGIAAAQQAYVDFGLKDDASFARVSSLIQQITTDAAGLRSNDYSGNAVGHLEEFWTALSALTAAETQAGKSRELGDDLAAADLLFGTPRPQVATLAERLRAFSDAEAGRLRAERASLSQQSWMTIGGVAIFWVAGLLMLAPLPAQQTPEPKAGVEEPLRPTASVAVAPPAIGGTKPVAPSPALSLSPSPTTNATESQAAAPRPQPARRPTPAPSVDLTATAALCRAITQVTDSSAIPAILEKSARLLDAHGIIVWMGAGDDLFPAAAFGYDPAMVARLRPIARTADNATAAAWRTGELRTVMTDGPNMGAIVAPMFGGNECIGVLAAEVRHSREQGTATRAATAIVAAQLAGILGAWPAPNIPGAEKAADQTDPAPATPTDSDRQSAAT